MIYILVEKTASHDQIVEEIKLRYFNQESNIRLLSFGSKEGALQILSNLKESDPEYNKNLVFKEIKISIT